MQQLKLAHELDTYIQRSGETNVAGESLPLPSAVNFDREVFVPPSAAVPPKVTDNADSNGQAEQPNFLLF